VIEDLLMDFMLKNPRLSRAALDVGQAGSKKWKLRRESQRLTK
jgi:hypothetical protein